MSGIAFDTDVVIDALQGVVPARDELHRAVSPGNRAWISRMVWIEVTARAPQSARRGTERFLSGFAIDELDEEISARAADLCHERPSIQLTQSIILATALVRGRVLVTRNTKDFPANMPGIRIPYTL